MGGMAVVLTRSGRQPGVDLVVKFLEHFAAISEALDGLGLWDETDGLYYDRLKTPSGQTVPVRVRSMVASSPPWRPRSSARMISGNRSRSASGSRNSPTA